VTARRRLVALALPLAILFGVLALLAAEGTLRPGAARAWADREIRAPVEDLGPAGPLLFVAVMAGATVLLFPGPITAGLSGLLFGTAVGFPTTLAATLLGGVLAFSIARWWAHDAVEELAGRRLRALRAWVGRRGFLSVLYARIAPGVPYNLVNYAAGLAPVRLVAFTGATAIGAAPRSFAYTALGGSLGDLRSPEALVAVGVLVAVGIVGLTLGVRAAGSAAATSFRGGRSADRL
jgi:uncharacterized membrane protein YdjX (TVP38/TMEM64 family)